MKEVMRELALFAGAGGGILGGVLLGWRTVCAVEINAYCARRLMQRQNEGHLPPFPIWDDVCTFDGRPWRGAVDVVSGGFPCQDISSAGQRKGIDGEHSGLWREMARIISETRPVFVLIENSPHLRTRGLVRVLKDLDGMGYNTSRGVFGAEDCGAPHPRKRMWIVANTDDGRKRVLPVYAEVASASTADGVAWPVQVADLAGVKMGARGFAREHVELAVSEGCARMSANSACVGRGQGRPRRLVAGMERQQELPFQEPSYANGSPLREQPGRGERQNGQDSSEPGGADWWPLDLVSGMDDGVASRVERVRATGNGQVPTVVRLAWETLRPWA